MLQPRFPTPFSKMPPHAWFRWGRTLALICTAAFCAAAVPYAHAATVDARLRPVLDAAGPAQTIPVWVRLRDKGSIAKVRPDVVSARSLRRRAKVRPAGALVDLQDMPVYEPYVDAVLAQGARLRQRSAWMRRASRSAGCKRSPA